MMKLKIDCSELEYSKMVEYANNNNKRIEVSGDYYVLKDVESSPDIQIIALKNFLKDTDYVIIKLYEAKITDSPEYEDMAKEYADIIFERKVAREKINKLQAEE